MRGQFQKINFNNKFSGINYLFANTKLIEVVAYSASQLATVVYTLVCDLHCAT